MAATTLNLGQAAITDQNLSVKLFSKTVAYAEENTGPIRIKKSDLVMEENKIVGLSENLKEKLKEIPDGYSFFIYFSEDLPDDTIIGDGLFKGMFPRPRQSVILSLSNNQFMILVIL